MCTLDGDFLGQALGWATVPSTGPQSHYLPGQRLNLQRRARRSTARLLVGAFAALTGPGGSEAEPGPG